LVPIREISSASNEFARKARNPASRKTGFVFELIISKTPAVPLYASELSDIPDESGCCPPQSTCLVTVTDEMKRAKPPLAAT
jgi:hypothetical protein